MASKVPATSALRITFKVLALGSMLVGESETVLAPTEGTVLKPKTRAGQPGKTAVNGSPFSLNKALTLPVAWPRLSSSPSFKVPCLTITVATGPRCLSRKDSITTAWNGAKGLFSKPLISVNKRIISKSWSRFLPVLAEISTQTISPPKPSTITPASAKSFLTIALLALGKSILLMATRKGTWAALMWSKHSLVCGLTLSTASMTKTTKSVTWAPRERIEAKAAWPGVSIKVIFLPW